MCRVKICRIWQYFLPGCWEGLARGAGLANQQNELEQTMTLGPNSLKLNVVCDCIENKVHVAKSSSNSSLTQETCYKQAGLSKVL